MKYAVTIFFLLSASVSGAQPTAPELPDAVRRIIENLTAHGEEEQVDVQALYDTYEALLENPIDLNTATAADLQQLQLLTDFQVQSLLEYRKEYGMLYSLHELPLIHGFNEELAAQLSPFLTVVERTDERPVSLADRFTRGGHQIVMRTGRTLETQQGYTPIGADELAARPNARYLGAPWTLHTRYRYRYKNKMQWNFTAEKDAGEPFFAGSNRSGFDFYSAHVQIADWGIVKRCIIGDYQMQFGQGLVAWGGYSLSKAGDALAIKKQERGLTGYTSTDENNFRRGAALTLQHRQWNLSAFVSYKNIDATADSSEFASLQTTGQHNTASSMAYKHSLSETVAGGNLSYRGRWFKLGFTALWYRYGKDYRRDVRPYNLFELNESHNANAGLDFYGVWRNLSLFGEVAGSANGGWAAVAGALFDIDPSFRLSLLYRDYGRDYQAMYARGFGETDKTANENGYYVGAQWLPHPDITVSAYADAFRFPWMRYRVYTPSHGTEYWLQINYQPTNTWSMYFRLKQEQKEQNESSGNAAIVQAQTVDGMHLRYEMAYELLAGLTMEDRIEWALYRAGVREDGWLLYHDVQYKRPDFPVDASVRFAIFDTDSWNARFYAYENDMLYAFSVPAYYSKGARWYFNLHVKFTKRIDAWLRFAQTYFVRTATFGDGLTQIDQPHQTTFKLQLSWKL